MMSRPKIIDKEIIPRNIINKNIIDRRLIRPYEPEPEEEEEEEFEDEEPEEPIVSKPKIATPKIAKPSPKPKASIAGTVFATYFGPGHDIVKFGGDDGESAKSISEQIFKRYNKQLKAEIGTRGDEKVNIRTPILFMVVLQSF